MPKGNIIGNRKMNQHTKLRHSDTVNAQVSRSLAGLIGNSALQWKRLHEMGVSGDRYRKLRAIKIYILHTHRGRSVLDISQLYNMRTDEVRRVLHETKRMFDKWRELNEESQIN